MHKLLTLYHLAVISSGHVTVNITTPCAIMFHATIQDQSRVTFRNSISIV